MSTTKIPLSIGPSPSLPQSIQSNSTTRAYSIIGFLTCNPFSHWCLCCLSSVSRRLLSIWICISRQLKSNQDSRASFKSNYTPFEAILLWLIRIIASVSMPRRRIQSRQPRSRISSLHKGHSLSSGIKLSGLQRLSHLRNTSCQLMGQRSGIIYPILRRCIRRQTRTKPMPWKVLSNQIM